MRKRQISGGEIYPDEIFLDSQNMPTFNTQQFEGRIECPISARSLYFLGAFFFIIVITLGWKLFSLQVRSGDYYLNRSMINTLRLIPIPPTRATIKDTNGILLAWDKNDSRQYAEISGLSHLVGYVGHPDVVGKESPLFTASTTVGIDGIERQYDDRLAGSSGVKIIEIDAFARLQSENVRVDPIAGQPLELSIDSRIQEQLSKIIQQVATDYKYKGGAGIIMDVRTGELKAITSYPEYDSNIMSGGKDAKKVNAFLAAKDNPFLNRAISGLYAPGSIIKPFMAIAALGDGVITPEKRILSTGQLVLENEYDKDHPSIFKDWKVHGWVDMREALAESSDEYFYQIGGGYKTQKGVGIDAIGKYARLFGFGAPTGIVLGKESIGTIPSPKWKADNFAGDPWRVGDTYHTVIGQYGFQVTPIQVARAIAAIATDGRLLHPTLLKSNGAPAVVDSVIAVPAEDFKVVKEGMRLGVTSDDGTGKGLRVDYVKIASKTGTAEVGITRTRVNSWVIGFFPYDDPRYVFTVVMEAGDKTNTIGALYVMRQLFDWMFWHTPEYFKSL